MRIDAISQTPLSNIEFLNAGKGQGGFFVDQLPIYLAKSSSIPAGLDAIVITSDLQGRERFEDGDNSPPRLLGEVLPGRLKREVLPDLNVQPTRSGAVLAGDFFTVPNLDRRGGSGDVTTVWRAFAREFRWVAGVAGNHDTFGESLSPTTSLASNAFFLDGTTVTVDGLCIGGVGGIIGNPRKPHRKADAAYARSVVRVLADQPDLLVLHDGPEGEGTDFRGSPAINHAIGAGQVPLVVRGHRHWPKPLVELENGTQVLNAEFTTVVVQRTG